MLGRGRCREIRIQILNILNILNLTWVLKTFVISNILNILNILNLGFPRHCACCALECVHNKTNNIPRIVSPQRTFCVLGTNMKEAYRTLKIVSPQRTFCVLGKIYIALDIVSPQRTFCVLGINNNSSTYVLCSRNSYEGNDENSRDRLTSTYVLRSGSL